MHKLILVILLLYPNYCFAYLGPGMGGGLIAATVGIVIALFALIFGIVWFPLKRFFKNYKDKKNNKDKGENE